MDLAILERIGLTEAESKVYLALLTLGNTTTGPLIDEANVASSKVYRALEKLEEHGLVTENTTNNIKHYEAVTPQRILDLLEEQEALLKTEKEQFTQLLPELIARQHIQEQQEVKLYTGFSGIKSLYDEILERLDEHTEYLALTFRDSEAQSESIVQLFQKFHHERANKGAKAKIIAHKNDKRTRQLMNYSQTPKYAFRITDQEFPTGTAICGDIVATFIWGETPKAFVIISSENAERHKVFFEALWKVSEPA